MAGILFSSLRATNKTNTITTVRQNGNYALSQITKMIKNAKSFEGVRVSPTPPPAPAPEFNSSCSDTAAYNVLRITTFDSSLPEVIFICNTGNLLFNGVSLVDTSAVKVDSCSFKCFQSSPSDFPTIEVDFNLSQAAANPVFEKKASIEFRTSVTMRNLNR